MKKIPSESETVKDLFDLLQGGLYKNSSKLSFLQIFVYFVNICFTYYCRKIYDLKSDV